MRKVPLAALAFILTTASALAQTPTVQRLRGTIESVDASALVLTTSDGKNLTVALAPDTKVAGVTMSSLDAVKDGIFIGTATKGENPPIALEVVLFPESMRGTGEGHYDWDEIADTTTAAGNAPTKSMMTNGTIQSATPAAATTQSTMTNGAVKSATAEGGVKKLTVTYGNGKSIDITVPPTAPIVALAPADVSMLKAGGKVFIVAGTVGDKLSAKRILAGVNGVTPPM